MACQTSWLALEHDVAGCLGWNVVGQRQALENAFQLGAAQQIRQRGPQIVKLARRGTSRLLISRGIKPRRFAICNEQLSPRFSVFPPHASGTLDPQSAGFGSV